MFGFWFMEQAYVMISMDQRFKHKTNEYKYFISCQNRTDCIQKTDSVLDNLRIQKL